MKSHVSNKLVHPGGKPWVVWVPSYWETAEKLTALIHTCCHLNQEPCQEQLGSGGHILTHWSSRQGSICWPHFLCWEFSVLKISWMARLWVLNLLCLFLVDTVFQNLPGVQHITSAISVINKEQWVRLSKSQDYSLFIIYSLSIILWSLVKCWKVYIAFVVWWWHRDLRDPGTLTGFLSP